MVMILDDRSLEELKMSITQVQIDYQTKEWYIVANIFKYESDNLTVVYTLDYQAPQSLLFETL